MRKIRLDDSCLNHLTNILVGNLRVNHHTYIHSEKSHTKFADRGCVRTWRNLYRYATVIVFCCSYSDNWRRKNATIVCSRASEIRYNKNVVMTITFFIGLLHRIFCGASLISVFLKGSTEMTLKVFCVNTCTFSHVCRPMCVCLSWSGSRSYMRMVCLRLKERQSGFAQSLFVGLIDIFPDSLR